MIYLNRTFSYVRDRLNESYQFVARHADTIQTLSFGALLPFAASCFSSTAAHLYEKYPGLLTAASSLGACLCAAAYRSFSSPPPVVVTPVPPPPPFKPEPPPEPVASPAPHTPVATPGPTLLGWIAKKILLPSRDISKANRAKLAETYDRDWSTQDLPKTSPLFYLSNATRNGFQRTHLSIPTWDNVNLHAIRYQSTERPADTPPKSVLIYCNPNGDISDRVPCRSLLLEIPGYDCDVINFDYRSTGGSTGEFNAAQDLVNDAISVAEWAQNILGVDPSQIHFVGHSLGGAVAVKAKAALGKTWRGDVVADRSFSSIKNVAEKFVKISGRLLPKYLNLEVTKDELRSLGGKATILYLQEGTDRVIRAKAGMHHLWDSSTPNVRIRRLEPNVGEGYDLHNLPVGYFSIDGDSAHFRIIESLRLPTFNAHVVPERVLPVE